MICPSFKMRMVSGFILGPLTLLAIIYGGIAFQLFVGIAFGISVKEWIGMTRRSKHFLRDSILGIAYMVLCYSAFLKLRLDFDQGLFLTFCLMIGVWASDIGAYFSGKFIGGPKLAVKISPNKTWAGLGGGIIASALMLAGLNSAAPVLGSLGNLGNLGNLTGLDILPFASLKEALLIGAMFTVIGQIGDLLISGYKRKVDVKDTGCLIPGHGGLLDRIDSLMLVTLFFLIVLSELS